MGEGCHGVRREGETWEGEDGAAADVLMLGFTVRSGMCGECLSKEDVNDFRHWSVYREWHDSCHRR